jgi:hypothetical protein
VTGKAETECKQGNSEKTFHDRTSFLPGMAFFDAGRAQKPASRHPGWPDAVAMRLAEGSHAFVAR